MTRAEELLAQVLKKEKEECKACKILLWVLAVVGIIAAVAAIAYAVYRFVKPECLEEMKELARKLAEGFPFVRVDFYQVNGKVYLGEMTFTPGMFLAFSSKEWDRKLGDLLVLPEIENKEEK